jgi:hypothetical protein
MYGRVSILQAAPAGRIAASLAATFVCGRSDDRRDALSATGPAANVIFNNGTPVCAAYDRERKVFQADIKTSERLTLGPYPLVVEVRQGGAVVVSRQFTITIVK